MSIALTTLRGISDDSRDESKHEPSSDSESGNVSGLPDDAKHGNLSALEIQIKEKKNRLLDIQIQEKEDEAKNKHKTKKQRFCETWCVFALGLF